MSSPHPPLGVRSSWPKPPGCGLKGGGPEEVLDLPEQPAGSVPPPAQALPPAPPGWTVHQEGPNYIYYTGRLATGGKVKITKRANAKRLVPHVISQATLDNLVFSVKVYLRQVAAKTRNDEAEETETEEQEDTRRGRKRRRSRTDGGAGNSSEDQEDNMERGSVEDQPTRRKEVVQGSRRILKTEYECPSCSNTFRDINR